MSEGYVVLRKSTVAWLLEKYRRDKDEEIPFEVAIDLRENVIDVDAPIPEEDRLKTLGPVLSVEEHIQLLMEDEDLKLPTDNQGSNFWKMVSMITWTMLKNEAECVLRILGAK